MNESNKKRAQQVLALADEAFSNGDARDDLVDLLANVRHACDLNDLPFGEMDHMAHLHYVEECARRDKAFLPTDLDTSHAKPTALASLWLSLEKLDTEINSTAIPLLSWLGDGEVGSLITSLESATKEIQRHFDEYKLQAIRRKDNDQPIRRIHQHPDPGSKS